MLEILGEPIAVGAEDGVETLAVYRFGNPNVEQGPPISAIGEVELNISLVDGLTVNDLHRVRAELSLTYSRCMLRYLCTLLSCLESITEVPQEFAPPYPFFQSIEQAGGTTYD